MSEWKFVYRNEWNLNLKKIDSILLPILLNQNSLVLVLKTKANTNYFGKLKQLDISFPNKLVTDTSVIRYPQQRITFNSTLEQFQLEFVPSQYLGLFQMWIYILN